MLRQQAYKPIGRMVLSTVLAAVQVAVMMIALGFPHINAQIAAGLGLAAASAVAALAYGMPGDMAGRAAVLDGLSRRMPIGGTGVAMAGSATASAVFFGGRQQVAAAQVGPSPNLMGAANISGGVVGKMIDAQSIVVTATPKRWFNHEVGILHYMLIHSIALVWPIGLFVTLQAYLQPSTSTAVY